MDWKETKYRGYFAHPDGRIMGPNSQGKGKIPKPLAQPKGTHYRQVNIKSKTRYVHTVIAETFIGLRPPGAVINHKDGNKMNNRAENLEWVTPKQNTAHAKRLGLIPRGESHKNSKITNTQALEIFYSTESKPELMKRYGVGRNVIEKIKNKKAWLHIHGELCTSNG